MMNSSSDDGNIGPTLWSVAIAGALLTLVSPLLFGARGVVSCGLGAALAVANLWAIARLVRGLLGAAQTRKISWGPLGILKLAGIFVLLAVFLQRGWAEVLPLAFGYLSLPVGIVLAQLKTAAPARGEN
jgi:hypothetical protein